MSLLVWHIACWYVAASDKDRCQMYNLLQLSIFKIRVWIHLNFTVLQPANIWVLSVLILSV